MAFPFVASGTGTDQELLDLVREAISVILGGGQEYEIRGRRFMRADLHVLYQMEKDLVSRVRMASSTGLVKNQARLARKPTNVRSDSE